MIGPQGAAQHPVRLDHYQRIREVGWSADEYLTLSIEIVRRSVVKDYPYPATATPPPVPPPPDQPVDWTSDEELSPAAGAGNLGAHEYVTGFQYEWRQTPEPVGSVFHKGAWSDDVRFQALDGLPEMPRPFTVEPWTVVFGNQVSPDNVLSWWPRAEYLPLSGGGVAGLSVPDHAELPFVADTRPELQMRGWAFGAGPLQGQVGDMARTPYLSAERNAKYGTHGPVNTGTEEGIDFTFAPLTVELGGIIVTHRGRPWRAVGAAVQTFSTSAPTTPGFLWVLCQKVESP